jgi:hypothetical protein
LVDPGFKVAEYSRVELIVDQVQNLNAALAPSAAPEKVTVLGESLAPVDLNDAQIGNVVSSQQVETIPLILRDPYQLTLLSPGAIQSNSQLQGISVNGSRERNNNFLLDGTDNNDAEIPGLSLPQPGLAALNPDAVEEFRVIYAHNTFGGSIGGALRRDKTFGFANYEGQRFVTTLTNTSTVPTVAFKTGQFNFSGQPVDVSTPGSTNNIFVLPLDPTSQKILALYPAPNGPKVDDVRGKLYFPSRTSTTGDNVTARVDHSFTRNRSKRNSGGGRSYATAFSDDSFFANAPALPTSRYFASSSLPKSSINFATRPVQPV